MAKKSKQVKVEVLTDFHVGIDTKVDHYKKGITYVDSELASRASASGLVKIVVKEAEGKEQGAKGKEAKK